MSSSLRLAIVFLLLILASCNSSVPARAIERLALVPFENLTGDRAFDWMARAVPTVLHRQLATSRQLSTTAYPRLADAVLGRATRLLHGSVERIGSEVRFLAYVEDGLSHRQIGDRIELRVPSGQVLLAIDRLAHRLASDASAAPARQPAAVAALIEAQTALQPEAKSAALSRSAQLDPQFAMPALALAELSMASGRREDSQAALASASGRQLNAIEREQVALLQANLAQDRAAQAQALQKLSEAAPLQPDLQIFAASLLQRLRQVPPAVAAFERSLRVDPENADVLNRLGYAQGYLGRLPAARQALESYRSLEPNEPNPLDSLGEVHYAGGDFKTAAGYFQAAHNVAPKFDGGRALLKAAYALLLDGQFEPAEQALEKYAKTVGPSSAVDVARAHFLYASGRPEEAAKYLGELSAKSAGPDASLYQTHRCGLLLQTKRAEAQAAATAAMAAARTPAAALCQFLSQPSASPAEWSARAERALPGAGAANFRTQALANALFFDRHFNEAFPLVESLLQQTNPDSDSEIRVLYAECLWRTGRWPSARETVSRWPLPAPNSFFAGRNVPAYVLAILKTGEHFDDNAVAARWSPIGAKVLRVLD